MWWDILAAIFVRIFSHCVCLCVDKFQYVDRLLYPANVVFIFIWAIWYLMFRNFFNVFIVTQFLFRLLVIMVCSLSCFPISELKRRSRRRGQEMGLLAFLIYTNRKSRLPSRSCYLVKKISSTNNLSDMAVFSWVYLRNIPVIHCTTLAINANRRKQQGKQRRNSFQEKEQEEELKTLVPQQSQIFCSYPILAIWTRSK